MVPTDKCEKICGSLFSLGIIIEFIKQIIEPKTICSAPGLGHTRTGSSRGHGQGGEATGPAEPAARRAGRDDGCTRRTARGTNGPQPTRHGSYGQGAQQHQDQYQSRHPDTPVWAVKID